MQTNDFLTECEQRLHDLQARRKALVESLDQEIEAYERIVAGERARGSTATGAAQAPVLARVSLNGSKINQTQFIRDALASGDGVTPRELRAMYRETTGQKPHQSFPYTRLYNMKAKGQVRVEDGKYYQVQQSG